MPTIRFLARTIEAITPSAGRVEYWDRDLKGFGLRVSESGRKTWVAMYRHHGRLRRLTLGTYPNVPLVDARKRADAALRGASGGKDPAGEKKAARLAETFRELADEYVEKYAKKKKRSWREDKRALDRDILPKFGQRKAGDIRRHEVIDLLEKIVERGAPVLANRTLEIMRRIYNWGIEREVVLINPCARVTPPGAENERERVLTDDEIRRLWPAFGELTPAMAAIFQLRLLTLQRGGEVSRLRWSDLDTSAAVWTIPAEFSKNGIAHRVSLSAPAIEIIGRVGRITGVEWVFPSPNDARKPITHFWKVTVELREATRIDFVPHDLRRTGASKMTGDLGISRSTVGKILNHVDRSVTSIYDRHSYDGEKRQALEAWPANICCR
jgi:integrase